MGEYPSFVAYPLFRLTLFLAAGIFLSDGFLLEKKDMPWLLLGGLFFLVLSIGAHSVKRYHYRMFFGIFACIVCMLVGAILLVARTEHTFYLWPSAPTVYQGTVMEVPRKKARTWQSIVKVESIRDVSSGVWKKVDREVLMYWMPDSLQGNLECGDRFYFKAKIERPVSERELIGFDYGQYLARQGIAGTGIVYTGNWKISKRASSYTLRQKALLLREKLVRQYRNWGLEGDELAVVAALTVGDKSELTKDLKSMYSAAGTSHVLALSGLHIGIIASIFLFTLSPLRVLKGGKIFITIVLLFLLWGFAFLTGLSASVVRAVTMFSLYGVASICSENRYSGMFSLSLAAFLMLLYQPLYLFDVSFQLSCIAVFFILLLMPLFQDLFRGKNRIVRYVGNTVAISVAAQMGTMPFILYYFGSFPTYFLLANLVVTPLAICIIGAAIIAFLFSCFSIVNTSAIWMLSFVTKTMNNVMEFVQHLMGAQLTSVYFTAWQSLLLLLLLFSVIMLIHRRSFIRFANVMLISVFLIGTGIYYQVKPSEKYLYFGREHLYLKTDYHISQLPPSIGLYKIGDLHVGLMNNGRWQNKKAGVKPLQLDYLYLCRGFRGSLEQLSLLFDMRTVVLDRSLPEWQANLLLLECERLNLSFIDLSEKGSLGILL